MLHAVLSNWLIYEVSESNLCKVVTSHLSHMYGNMQNLQQLEPVVS
jgi:hypothetical protein